MAKFIFYKPVDTMTYLYDEDFCVDISCRHGKTPDTSKSGIVYEAYLYEKPHGVKMLMFTSTCRSYDECEEMVFAALESGHITKFYRETYMDA